MAVKFKSSAMSFFVAAALTAAASSCVKTEPFQNALPPSPVVQAPAEATKPAGLSGGNFKTFDGGSYKAQILEKTMMASIDLKTPSSSAPLFEKAVFIAWGDGWARLLDQGALQKSKRSLAGQDGSAIAKLSGSNEKLKLEAETALTPGEVKLSYKIEALADIPKIQRLSVELGPSWDAVAGAEIQAVMEDGTLKTASIPKEPTKDGAYETLLSGRAKSLSVKGLYGIKGAEFKAEGPFNLALEQTGKRFRWHLGAPIQAGAPMAKGESASFNVLLSLPALPESGLSQSQASVEVDCSAGLSKISPYVFGAQLSHIGFGVKAGGMRNAWQNNPKYDLEFKKLVQESGVSFFRIYAQHLYDTLGQCGGSTSQDPICPSEGAPCDYSRADAIVEALKEMGIETMPCVALYCPPWLSTQRKSPYYSGLWMIHRAPPKDNAKLAAILAGMVRHFNVEKGYGVKLWQVGNEPNDWTRYWVGGTMPEFEEFFKTASKAMKEADPSIQISGPDLSDLYAKAWPEKKLSWKDEFAKDCKGSFDNFSFNCYGTTDFSGFLKDARETLEKQGLKGMGVYVAEYNSTAGDYDNSAIFDFKGALFIAKALKSLIESKVERASYYAFYGDNLGFFNERDGKLVPRPSYQAFRMHASLGLFKNASLLKSDASDGKLSALACRHEDGRGYSIVLASDNPMAPSFIAKLSLKGAEGAFKLRQFVYEDGMDSIQELPERRVDVAAPIEAKAAGRAVTLLLLRAD